MNVYIKPTSQIIGRLGLQTGGPAQKFFCNECYRQMTKFVPGGVKSHLNQNVSLAIDGSYVLYNGPDAHYLFNGNLYVDPKYKVGAFPIRNGKISFKESDGPIEGFVSRPGIPKEATGRKLEYNHPGTGAHWDKLMWSSCGDEVVKAVQKFIERGCK